MTPTVPTWVRDDVVREVHRRQLAEHGGADGVRDPSLIASALDRPRNAFVYGNPTPDLAALAAACAFGVARNHPFADGNKRTAFVACLLFLRLNGHDISATQDEEYTVFLGLAAGTVSESELADWLRARLTNAPNHH